MALDYILSQLGFKLGLNPADAGQRSTLLRYINRGAPELYRKNDIPGALMEQSFQIMANQTIAMPDYVGHIRAMREQMSHIAINLEQQRPRYNQYNWSSEWRDWRLKGLSPLQTSIINQAQLILTVPSVEDPPVQVTITGTNDESSSVSEIVTINAQSVSTVNNYNDITSITKSRVNQFNITISDVDGNQLSYLANNKLRALFQIVDISTSPWYPQGVNPLCGWVEVLYKKALPTLQNDNDEFPVPGYDDILVDKCLQLYYEDQKDIQTALAYMTKVNNSLAEMQEDTNRGTDDCVSITEPPSDRINPRVGYGRDYWYAYRIQGR